MLSADERRAALGDRDRDGNARGGTRLSRPKRRRRGSTAPRGIFEETTIRLSTVLRAGRRRGIGGPRCHSTRSADVVAHRLVAPRSRRRLLLRAARGAQGHRLRAGRLDRVARRGPPGAVDRGDRGALASPDDPGAAPSAGPSAGGRAATAGRWCALRHRHPGRRTRLRRGRDRLRRGRRSGRSRARRGWSVGRGPRRGWAPHGAGVHDDDHRDAADALPGCGCVHDARSGADRLLRGPLRRRIHRGERRHGVQGAGAGVGPLGCRRRHPGTGPRRSRRGVPAGRTVHLGDPPGPRLDRRRPAPLQGRRRPPRLEGHRQHPGPGALRRLQRLHLGVPDRGQAVHVGVLPAPGDGLRSDRVVELPRRSHHDDAASGRPV